MPKVSMVVMERDTKTGRIVNQEWWSLKEFKDLLVENLDDSRFAEHYKVYLVSDIPDWIKGLLKLFRIRPYWLSDSYVSELEFSYLLKKKVFDRLKEDKNNSKK